MTDCHHLKIFNQVAEKSSLDIAVITGDEPHILPSIKNSGLRKIFKAIKFIENNVVLFEKHYIESSIENVAAKFIKDLEMKINLNN